MRVDANDKPRRAGYTLIEVMVVSTIMGILVVIPIPLFARAIEQSKLDLAASNLRAVWCAERYFYLENNRYGSLAELSPTADASGSGLIDPSMVSGLTYYGYAIDVSDGQSFAATATHPPSPRYSGSMTIDQTGRLNCQVMDGTSSVLVQMKPSLEPQ